MKLSKAWPLAASLGVMPPVHFSGNPTVEEAVEASSKEGIYKGPGYERHEAINCGDKNNPVSDWWRTKQAMNLVRDSVWKVYSPLKDSSGDRVPESRLEEIVGDQKGLETKKGEETATFTMVLIDPTKDRTKWTLTAELGQYGSCAAYLRETSPKEETIAYHALKVVHPDGRTEYFNGGASCDGFKDDAKCSIVDLKVSPDVDKRNDEEADLAMGWAMPSETTHHAQYMSTCKRERVQNPDGTIDENGPMTVFRNPEWLTYPYDEDGVKRDPLGKQLCEDLIKKARESAKDMGLKPFMTQADLD